MITRVIKSTTFASAALASILLSSSCVPSGSLSRDANMIQGSLDGATVLRDQKISSEPTGDFYYARRYFVEKTRFWGYLRKPRQPWSEAKLVVMNESSMRQPDRLPEDGPWNARHGFDQNYEYRITGHFTGQKIYDPSSNLILPEFKATGYTRISTNGGWLFTPQDHYDSKRITLRNASVQPIQ